MNEGVVKFFRAKPVPTPIIAVTGGKGGAGKTTIAVNLAVALEMYGNDVLLVDLDVDCPNAAMLFGEVLEGGEDITFFKPRVNVGKCIECGKCAEACPEKALLYIRGRFPILFEELCSGCAACQLACPTGAIEEACKVLGKVYVSEVDGIRLISGELKLTEARSPLVALKTKQKVYEVLASESFDVILIDTAPGVHNPVVRALQGADLALAVTEPTPLGAHDLGRILELTNVLGIPADVVLNRADVEGGPKRVIYEICERYGVKVISEIPFDEKLIEAYVRGVPIVKFSPDSPSSRAIFKLAERVSEKLNLGIFHKSRERRGHGS